MRRHNGESAASKEWTLRARWLIPVDGPPVREAGVRIAGARESWAQARAWLERHRAADDCRVGLSPHAPYSARRSLFTAAFRCAERHGMPVSIHWAETAEEIELLEKQWGGFVSFLKELGAW